MIKRLMTKRFLGDESGGAAIEYSMIALLIATLLIVSLVSMGGSLTDIFVAVQAGFN